MIAVPAHPAHTLDTPENIAEARRRIQAEIERLMGFEGAAAAQGDLAAAGRFRAGYRAMQRFLLGNGTCRVAAFDEVLGR